MTKTPIVLAADAKYAMPLAVTLRSIVEANRRHWPLEFYILHDGFSEELRKKVDMKMEKEKTVSCPVYYDGESVAGQVRPHLYRGYGVGNHCDLA